ncbi:MAG: YigZ family protein [Chloroflexota bacterium]
MAESQPVMLVPSDQARVEIRVVNSRFIGSVAPVTTVEEAKSFIAGIRAEMPDANHHVYAYIIGHGATTTQGMSDDGEPSGTAGRPALSVVRGSGLGDVAVVVTRYFGGTLLGTGGLVHAYSEATKEVLAIVPREQKIERQTVIFTVPYAAYESTQRLIEAHTGVVETEDFATDVTIDLALPVAEIDAFSHAIQELTAGQTQIITPDQDET